MTWWHKFIHITTLKSCGDGSERERSLIESLNVGAEPRPTSSSHSYETYSHGSPDFRRRLRKIDLWRRHGC